MTALAATWPRCRKGDMLFVDGRLDYWEAEGKRGKLMVAEVILEHFEFAGGSRGESAGRPRGAVRPAGPAPATAPADPFADDDIPF